MSDWLTFHRAIIVLELPWELDSTDANRSSVLPFISGIAKLAGDTDVLHANFYDESSLLLAAKCLAKSRHKNAVVYDAAHGGNDEPMSLGESLKFVIQPEGQGHRARNVSEDVFDLHAALHLGSGEDEDDEDVN